MVRDHWWRSVEPHLAAGSTVVLDSFHYRFRAKLAEQDAPTGPLDHLATELPAPRVVLFLSVDPEVAADRMGSFDRQEWVGEATRHGFLRFQRGLALRLEELCAYECAEVVSIDGTPATAEVVDRLVEAIERRLGGSQP
jgi:thymidylate kinase